MFEYKVIILAAGTSSRLQQPKQLLSWQGKPLLLHAVTAALEVTSQPVVVLGAQAAQLQPVVQTTPARVVTNAQFTEGIASSIRCGLQAVINESPVCNGVIFMVCDQPYASGALLKALVETHETTGQPIVASAYAGTLGIPAFFAAALFPQLLDLQGDAGAKKVILQNRDKVASVSFPQGHIDIDSIDDFNKLKQLEK